MLLREREPPPLPDRTMILVRNVAGVGLDLRAGTGRAAADQLSKHYLQASPDGGRKVVSLQQSLRAEGDQAERRFIDLGKLTLGYPLRPGPIQRGNLTSQRRIDLIGLPAETVLAIVALPEGNSKLQPRATFNQADKR